MLSSCIRRRLAVAVFCATAAASSPSAIAANWLMLQGTEPPKAKPHNFFGFIQPAVVSDNGPALSGLAGAGAANNGKYVANNLVGPALKEQEDVLIQRFFFGARGQLTDKINYFALADAGDSASNFAALGGRKRLFTPTDLSLTFNHIPGARVRVGLTRNPGAEEVTQPAQISDYIEFTDFANRNILERFTTGAIQPNGSPAAPALGSPVNQGYAYSIFRDWGVQVFDSFKQGAWDLSYAVKVGRGEAPWSESTGDFDPELYLFASAEYDLPGGKGPRKNGVKLYGWHQQGKRDFESDATGRKYDRIQQGVGFRALGKLFGSSLKHRVSGEYNQANGMIFTATEGNVKGGNLQYAAEKGNKARGWYLDYGIFPFQDEKWQFDVRYDRNDLLYATSANVNPGNKRKIQAWTFGVTHHFTPATKLTLNYTARDAKAPNDYVAVPGFAAGAAATTTANVRKIVDTLDDRIALQFTWIF